MNGTSSILEDLLIEPGDNQLCKRIYIKRRGNEKVLSQFWDGQRVAFAIKSNQFGHLMKQYAGPSTMSLILGHDNND